MHTGTRPRDDKGMVFVTMVAFVFLGLLSMMAIQRRLQTYINVLQQENQEAALVDGKRLAMAHALSVLQTGLPPDSPATYNIQLDELSAKPVYTVVFEEVVGTPVCVGTEPNWKVTVKDTNGTNPTLPVNF